jgi:hypothetical protein
MPFSMPMWPLVLRTAVTQAVPPETASGSPVRRRWLIVDETVRREVDESEFQAALLSCSRVEMIRDPNDDVVTTLCCR